MTAQPLLDVNDLTVEFATRRGIVKAVQHVDISVAKGETLGIVGEVRFRQIRDFLRGDADSRPCRQDCRGFGDVFRDRRRGRQRKRDARSARP